MDMGLICECGIELNSSLKRGHTTLFMQQLAPGVESGQMPSPGSRSLTIAVLWLCTCRHLSPLEAIQYQALATTVRKTTGGKSGHPRVLLKTNCFSRYSFPQYSSVRPPTNDNKRFLSSWE